MSWSAKQTVTIKSGFQRGAQVWRYTFDTNELECVAIVGDCTYKDDPVEEETVSWYPTNFDRHFVAYWRTDGHSTKVWSFDNLDTGYPTPELGIWRKESSFCSSEDILIDSLDQYLKAKVSNTFRPLQDCLINGVELFEEIVLDGGLVSKGIAFELDYEAGSQDAAKFLVVDSDGDMYTVKGCGHYTPWITPDGRITNDWEVADAMETAESMLG
jgi:hypothetical protein